MTEIIRLHTTSVAFADGTTWQSPLITKGKNGWVKPLKSQKFGRGYDGANAARKYLVTQLQTEMVRQHWAVPVAISDPMDISRVLDLREKAMVVAWSHPAFGQTLAKIVVLDSDIGEIDIQVELLCHPLANDMVAQQIREKYDWYGAARESKKAAYVRGINPDLTQTEFSASETSEILQEIAQRPFATIWKLWPQHKKYLEIPELYEQAWRWPPMTQEALFKNLKDKPVVSGSFNNVDLYINNNAGNIVLENLDTIYRVFEALKHKGLKIELVKSWQRGAEDGVLEGLKITIPKLENRQEKHFIEINHNTVRVVCGYENDEKKYQAYLKRNADKFMEELFGSEEPTYETYEIHKERNQ